MRKLVLSVLLLIASSFAVGANDGAVGTSSTGDITVRLAIPNAVQVSKLNDLDFGVYSNGIGDLVQTEPFCVYSRGSTPGGVYNITFTSVNSSGEGLFTMSNGVEDLSYSVMFDDSELLNSPVAMDSGTQISGQQGSNSRTCQGGNNAALEVTILAADIDVVSAGTYLDVLVITVSSI